MDRFCWVLLSRIWSPWRTSLIIIKPETVVKWYRDRFKLFWKFKSKPKGLGRPNIHSEIGDLVRKMATANPNWGAPRIHGELLRLGYVIILNKAHLKNILSSYFRYYHDDRTHLSLDKETPNSRPVESKPADKCKVVALPRVGGLHHRYTWKKAA